MRVKTILPIIALLVLLTVATSPVRVQADSCTQMNDPFVVTGSYWGTPTTAVSASPGDLDVPLTVTILYEGSCTIPVASFELALNGAAWTPFTPVQEGVQPTSYEANVAAGTSLTETYYVNIAPTHGQGYEYSVPSSFTVSVYILYTYSASASLENGAAAEITSTLVTLKGSATLTFASRTSALLGGAENNVTISIYNSGLGTAHSITPTISVPSGVTLLSSSQLPEISSIGPNSTATVAVEAFVPSSLAGSAASFSFSAQYYDDYSVSRTAAGTLGFMVTTVQPLAPFQVQGATWSSASASSSSSNSYSPAPGTQDTPLVVSVQYLESTPVTNLVGTLDLPSGITNLSGQPTATAYATSVSADQSIQLTFYLDLSNGLNGGSYNFTLRLTWMTSASSGLSEVASVTPPPIGQLESFQVQTVEWGTSSVPLTPSPGIQDIPLTVNVQYLGSTAVTSLEGSLAMPPGITDTKGQNSTVAYASTVTQNAVTYASTVSAGQSVTLTYYLDLGNNLNPGSYDFTLRLGWTSGLSSLAQTIVVSPGAVVKEGSTSSILLSLNQENSSVIAGSSSPVTFTLTNEGNEAVYSPTFSLAVSSPLILTGSTSTVPSAILPPGQTVGYTVKITSSPTASLGIYSGTLSVAYTDQSGNSHTQTFPVGLELTGSIIFVIQSTTVSESGATLSVSGTLLNEGTSPAYYTSISGAVVGASGTAGTSGQTSYLGEIQPNTPFPFTVIVPYSPTTALTRSQTTNTTSTASSAHARQSTATSTAVQTASGSGGARGGVTGSPAQQINVALTADFQDEFGNNKSQPFTVPATLGDTPSVGSTSTAAQQSVSNQSLILSVTAYAVVTAIVATACLGALYTRKARRRARERSPDAEKEEEDEEVL